MSKPKRTPVPLPGLQSKSKPTPQKTRVPPPKSALSQEFVNDSSDEETTTKKKTPVSIGIHPPNTNGASKATPKSAKKSGTPLKTAVKTRTPAKKVVPKQIVSKEQGAESTGSSSESEDEGTDIKAAQQRQSVSTQREASESSSSPSESEDEETDTKAAPKRQVASTKPEASESTSSSDTSSDESEDEPAPKATSQTQTSQPSQTQTQSHTVAFQAARPYVPPKDFVPVSTARSSSSQCTTIFGNLEGKQVWHITAPADVPLKALKELAMDQAMRGEAVVSHKGSNYGLSTAEEEAAGEREVVIPQQHGCNAVSARIAHTFNIRQVVDLPELSSLQADPNTGSEAAASITRSTIRAPRPQVKGLKMRYFPSGIEDHTPITLGLSDSEDDTQTKKPAGLGIPKDLHLAFRPEKKRKHAEVNGQDGVESSPKKHKKQRNPEETQRKAEKKAKKEKKKHTKP